MILCCAGGNITQLHNMKLLNLDQKTDKYCNQPEGGQEGAAPSRVQVIAVGCQRTFAARTAVTRFERHLVADLFCEPHETKKPH
jgi:hypothetical protein